MNKTKENLLVVGVVGIFAVLLYGAFFGAKVAAPTQNVGVVSSGFVDTYKTSTDSSVSCPSATSTLVLAAPTTTTNGVPINRKAFAAIDDNDSNKIYLCRGLTCSAATGRRLNAGGGWYEQNFQIDGYVGPYSCIASGSTSTLLVSYTQQ